MKRETKEDVVNKALSGLESSKIIKPDQNNDDLSLLIAEHTEIALKKTINAPVFQEAVKKFAATFDKNLTSEETLSITQKLQGIKITRIEGTSSYGMVLPDGIALNLDETRKLCYKEKPTMSESLQARMIELEETKAESQSGQEEEKMECEDQEFLQYQNALIEYSQEFLCASLWVAIHELGHFLIRTDEINPASHFGKITPPNKGGQEEGVEYENLEAGFLFSSIFFESLSKKVWKKPELVDRMLSIADLTNTPIFSADELQGLDRVDNLNLRNSGVFSADTGAGMF